MTQNIAQSLESVHSMQLASMLDISADTVTTVLFFLFATLTVSAGLVIVMSKNIIRTAVGLLFALLGVGGLYILMDAEFLAAVQLVVYAGGTLILIIFGVMLTSKSPFSKFEPKLPEVILALCTGMVMLAALLMAINNASGTFATNAFPSGDKYPTAQLGQALLGEYLVPFELVSVLLLVVMIGAAYLAKGRRAAVQTTPVAGDLSRHARNWS